MQIVKARGMAHSNQVREFEMTEHGITLVKVSRRADGSVAIGSTRGARQRRPAVRRPAAGAKRGRA
jgi:circadian clock protein KaiC